jgi:arginase
MHERLALIGAPSSAGAYAPGQERAPAALREVGLLKLLDAEGLDVEDRGDVSGFRWQPDRDNPRAMNAAAVVTVVREVAGQVATALSEGRDVLVLGGDCTVEIGTVAGALTRSASTGLVYVDLDTDLNTPDSTQDGALDWMVVSHLLGIEGTLPELAQVGGRVPLLHPHQVLLFASDNSEPFERDLIDKLAIRQVGLAEVVADPAAVAQNAIDGWAKQFEQILVHVDIDVLDFVDTPLAENTRRFYGLTLDQLLGALGPLLAAPNRVALTVCELNPDHGAGDGSTLRRLAEGLAHVPAPSPSHI